MWGREKIKEEREKNVRNLKNFLVLDIETVFDQEMFSHLKDKKIKKNMEEKGEDYFPPIPYHRIVAFSFILVKPENTILFESYCSEDEKELINLFWSKFRSAHSFKRINGNKGVITSFPVLITVNGKSFDMPVLKVRSLKYAPYIKDSFFISIYLDRFDKWENDYPTYTYPYTKYHIDLSVDIFSTFREKLSLKNLCYLSGIPAKTEGEGSQVADLFSNRELEKIAVYCAEDVKATAKLFSYINSYMLSGLYQFPSVEEISRLKPEIQVI